MEASGYTCCYQIQYTCFRKCQVYCSKVLEYRILEYFNQTLYLIGGIIRVLGPRRVLGPHGVLVPHRVLGPLRVLGPDFQVCRFYRGCFEFLFILDQCTETLRNKEIDRNESFEEVVSTIENKFRNLIVRITFI